MPTAQAVGVTNFSDEHARRRAVSWVMAGISTASIVRTPVLTTLVDLTSWRVSFMLMGGLALLAAVIHQVTLNQSARRPTGYFSARGLLDSYAPLRRRRPTILVVAASAGADAGMGCGPVYLSAFLVQRHGFSIDAVGWTFLAIGTLALSGNLVSGRVAVEPRTLLISGRIVNGLALIAAFVLPSSWLVSVGLILLARSTFAMAELTPALVLMVVSPAGRATTMTLRAAALSVGQALGGALGEVVRGLGEAIGV